MLESDSENIDAPFLGAQLQKYMWFDFSSQLGLLTPDGSVDSATLSWAGTVAASVFGSTSVESELGVFEVPDANKGINTKYAALNRGRIQHRSVLGKGRRAYRFFRRRPVPGEGFSAAAGSSRSAALGSD